LLPRGRGAGAEKLLTPPPPRGSNKGFPFFFTLPPKPGWGPGGAGGAPGGGPRPVVLKVAAGSWLHPREFFEAAKGGGGGNGGGGRGARGWIFPVRR